MTRHASSGGRPYEPGGLPETDPALLRAYDAFEAAIIGFQRGTDAVLPASTSPFVAHQLAMEPARLAYFMAMARLLGDEVGADAVARATGAFLAKCVCLLEVNCGERVAAEAVAGMDDFLKIRDRRLTSGWTATNGTAPENAQSRNESPDGA